MKDGASRSGLNFKKSNIRIWIHQRNMTNLQQVVWEGHGQKLLVEHSNNTKVRKFLEAVPYIMGLIKDVHCDVQNGDLDSLKNRITPPIPIAVLTAKDFNGLTPLHKAVGLGKEEIVNYIIQEVPDSVKAVDNEGRTPLHYAALLKDDNKMFNLLIESGADESALDNRQKTAAYYKTRVSELDAKLLNVVPDCPRGTKEPSSFDWNMLSSTGAAMINGITRKEVPRDENGLGEKVNIQESENNKEELEGKKEVEKRETESPTKNENERDAQEGDSNNAMSPEDIQKIEGDIPEPEDMSEKTPDSDQTPNLIQENEETENRDELGSTQEEAEESKEENNVDGSSENTDNNENNLDVSQEDEKNNTEEMEQSNDQQPDDNLEDNNETETEKQENEIEDNNNMEENIEGSRTRPSSKASRTPSPNENRPASNHTRPGTAVKETDEQNNNEQDNKGDSGNEETTGETETEGEGVIEGIVNGENEVESLNNENPNRSLDDPDIKSMIGSGNMEQLAALVLNGQGEKLIGQKSDSQELQTFLDNVPVYMSKINRIHMAARDGSLRDLQAALDRRKFAVARDRISPNGASPLHVAVIFGRTSIVRYLAGRFPETIHVEDDNGRTPLHYAAVLKDNGHYFNLLMHLGADNRIKDKLGHKPEYYIKNQSDFSHRQILLDFGAEVEADEILNDQDDYESARKYLDDEDMKLVLDRCFNVLHGRRNSSTVSATSNSTVSSGQSKPTYSLSVVSRHLKRNTFDLVKLRITKLDHNLYDIIWPCVKKLPTEMSIKLSLQEDFPLGIVAPDLYIYKVFEEFIVPIIKEYNYMPTYHELGKHPRSNGFFEDDKESDLDLDPQSKWIITGTLECIRNIESYELPKSLSPNDLEEVERLITDILLSEQTAKALYPNATHDEIKEKGSGTYYTMNEVLEDPSEARILLASNSLLIPLWNIPESDRLHGKYWPYGRGVFINNSCNLAVYVNVLDHIRIVTSTPNESPGTLGLVYSRLSRLMAILQDKLIFKFDQKLGHLSSRPTILGCGLHFSLTLKCPNLIKEPDDLKNLCAVRGLTYQRSANTTNMFKVSNYVTVGVTELKCFTDLTTAVANILQLEKDMAMSNSLHIAEMFVKIFKKKKSTTISS